MKSTYMCFLKDFKENRPTLALILRLTAIVGVDMMIAVILMSTPTMAVNLSINANWPVLFKIFQETHVSAFHYTII